MRGAPLVLCLMLSPGAASAAQELPVFTRADTLRGSNTPQRAWWDVTFYDLHANVAPSDSAVTGFNAITYDVLAPVQDMQIDLQTPLDMDSVLQDGEHLTFSRDGNAFFVALRAPQRSERSLRLRREGSRSMPGSEREVGRASCRERV